MTSRSIYTFVRCSVCTTICLAILAGCNNQDRLQEEFFRAIRTADMSLLHAVIEKGVDADATKDGWTALHMVLDVGHTPNVPAQVRAEIVSMLVEHGASVDARNTLGITPLFLASVYDYRQACELLIEAGADVNAVDNHGAFPLIMATEACNPEIVKLLLKAGADPDARDKAGRGALHRAARGAAVFVDVDSESNEIRYEVKPCHMTIIRELLPRASISLQFHRAA